jgi:hypothetical protein
MEPGTKQERLEHVLEALVVAEVEQAEENPKSE